MWLNPRAQMIGNSIAHYKVTAKLGEGGMGEVYRATDSKLGRDVALKVLPQAFTTDPQRMARFQREAQVLASLNHPNIAAIYGLENTNVGASFSSPAQGPAEASPYKAIALVMELVEGPTLAERIAGGAFPLDEALPIAKQIADALEYAHEHGIIHRDLKPANIKLTKDGQVKVLDFGLAKALQDEASAPDISSSPTLSVAATKAGVILGTAAYMSPEQAKGKSADRRADIWAFGVVLFEIFTGRRLFDAETASEILAAVLMKEPDLSGLPSNTPAKIRDLLLRCLNKDPKQRLQSIGEARIAIEQAVAHPGMVEPAVLPNPLQAAPPQTPWIRLLPWAVAAIAVGLAAFALLRPPPAAENVVTRFTIPFPAGAALGAPNCLNTAISPDGSQVAFVLTTEGRSQILTRAVNSLETAAVPETDGGVCPFFSPDGRWLGFVASGILKKVRLAGGVPLDVTTVDTADFRGGTWLADDSIVFSPIAAAPLSMVSANGGPAKPLTSLLADKKERTHRWPYALPGGKAVLFTVGTSDSVDNYDDSNIDAVVVATGQRKTVLQGASTGQYLAPTGQLIFARNGSLYAIGFDPEKLECHGEASPVLQGVQGNVTTGAVTFAVSNAGSLVYKPGVGGQADRNLIWFDRQGKVEALSAPLRAYADPQISPDGRRIALAIVTGRNSSVWTYDIDRNTLNRLTFDTSSSPIWSPDGKRVAFVVQPAGQKNDIAWKLADGSGETEILWESTDPGTPGSISSDGKWMALAVEIVGAQNDIYVLPLTGDRKPQAFVSGPATEIHPAFSPDVRWLAYESGESGRNEIYVKPFPAGAGRWQVSFDGGQEPRWSSDGKEIFYRSLSGLMAVSVEAQGTAFRSGSPKLLAKQVFDVYGSNNATYAVSKDGKRFLKIVPGETKESLTGLVVVQNWAEELRRQARAEKK